MNNLITQAVNNCNQMFATGSENVASSSSNKVYGLVQCTQDLSKDDCYLCLQDFVKAIHSHCNGKIGGNFFGTTCSLRYETYHFFSGTTDPNVEPSNKGNSGELILFWQTCWYFLMLMTLHEREPKSYNFHFSGLFFLEKLIKYHFKFENFE
jgi:Salt stress response/antifungal